MEKGSRVPFARLQHITIFSIFVLMILGCTFQSKTERSSKDFPDSVVFKTCSGCALKSFPEVAKFLIFDLAKYGKKLSLDGEAGGIPRLVLKDANGNDYRTLGISSLTLSQIRQVLSQIELKPKEELLAIADVNMMFESNKEELLLEVDKLELTKREESVTGVSIGESGDSEKRLPYIPKQKTDKEGKEIRFSTKRGVLDPSKLGQVESGETRGRLDDIDRSRAGEGKEDL